MDEEGSTGSQEDTVKLKEESKLMEEAIKEGIQKASEVSVQSHEDTVMQLTPTDRGRFYSHEYRIQAVKQQISRLKTRKIEDDFYKWKMH